MKNRIIGMMVIILMIIFIHPMTSFETDIFFDDVSENDWYYADVQKACESDFMEGFNDDTFRPEVRMTYAQIIKIAFELKQTYTEERIVIKEDDPRWYDSLQSRGRCLSPLHGICPPAQSDPPYLPASAPQSGSPRQRSLRHSCPRDSLI